MQAEDKEWALDKKGFRRLPDDKPADISVLPEDDNGIYYKDMPHTPHKLYQRLIITYSPKFARYQKTIRDRQIERAQKMIDSGSVKKERKNPDDPARFIGKIAVTEDALYDGLYAVSTDLLDDEAADIIKVSEGRWQIEECFRIMKTDFEARPVYLQNEIRIKAHFLSCFLALVVRKKQRQGINYHISKRSHKSPQNLKYGLAGIFSS